nr:hypothetical protein [Vibrio navarrensis]
MIKALCGNFRSALLTP